LLLSGLLLFFQTSLLGGPLVFGFVLSAVVLSHALVFVVLLHTTAKRVTAEGPYLALNIAKSKERFPSVVIESIDPGSSLHDLPRK
jgi:hypothetical protein